MRAGFPIDVIVYHNPCDDGNAAAAILLALFPDAKPIGMHPKDDPMITEEFCQQQFWGQCVAFVDIAFSAVAMLRVAAAARHVYVLDHHVTNQRELETLAVPNMHVTFDMSVSGVVLAWRFVHGDMIQMPRAFQYIGLKDVWQHKKVPDAVAFGAAFSRPKVPGPEWNVFYNEQHTQTIIEEGYVILEYQRKVVSTMIEKAELLPSKDANASSIRFVLLNAPFPWINETGEALCEVEPMRTVAVIWNKSVASGYSVSLRSHNTLGPDVERIAKSHGGGGHVHAAAFRTNMLPETLF